MSMSSWKTEKKANSQDKSILQNISIQDFLGFCHEYKVVQQSLENILDIADDPSTGTKEKIDIYKWLIEINIGKPKERILTEPCYTGHSAGIFIESLEN